MIGTRGDSKGQLHECKERGGNKPGEYWSLDVWYQQFKSFALTGKAGLPKAPPIATGFLCKVSIKYL